MILLEAHELACTFQGSKGAVEAVKPLNLALAEGDLIGLIGPDGAGKSTTFRMFTGLQRPTGGEVSRHIQREQLGYVSQKFSLPPDLTVEENMQLQAGLYGMNDPASRIKSLLESVDLDPFLGRMAGDLSGGMKQKLALCVALLPEPRLLLLDEPTTGVDPVSRREFWELLHAVHDKGVAILFSTPYMDEAEYAHRMILMHEGRVLGDGTLESFRAGLGGKVVRVLAPQRRRVQVELETLQPLDIFGEGEVIRARFLDQNTETLLERVRSIEGVEKADLSEATLEDYFLHTLSEQAASHA